MVKQDTTKMKLKQKHLSIRAFTDKQKREAFERQKGVCLHCTNTFTLDGMEADHITPWSEGGKTIPENLQMLCKLCNRTKSNKYKPLKVRVFLQS